MKTFNVLLIEKRSKCSGLSHLKISGSIPVLNEYSICETH